MASSRGWAAGCGAERRRRRRQSLGVFNRGAGVTGAKLLLSLCLLGGSGSGESTGRYAGCRVSHMGGVLNTPRLFLSSGWRGVSDAG